MPESLTEEIIRSRGPASDSPQTGSTREPKAESQSDAEHHGVHNRFRQLDALSEGAEPSPERFARIFGPGVFAHSANDAQRARILDVMQRQYGNQYVGKVLQRACECGGSGSCTACSSGKEEELLQRRGEGEASSLSDSFGRTMQGSGEGSPLDSGTRETMESRFGHRFDDVRVHTDSAAAAAARQIHASAFTTGRDIYFGAARYQPQTRDGQHLLAHELTHVVQQRSGAVGSGLAKSLSSSRGDGFEREADAVANQVVEGRPVSISGVTSGQPAPVQCAPDDKGGKAAPKKPCATPTDFKQTAASDAGGGVLHFEYAWKSSTGKLSDLGDCEVGEKVTYTKTEDPPFAAAPNPTVMWIAGKDGAFADNHSPSLTKPYKVSKEEATQYYRYHCPCSNKDEPVNVLGPISLTREITKKDGKFKFTIKKSGKTAEIDPLT